MIPASTIDRLVNDGDISILNVGAGDLRISFDSDIPADVDKARKAVEDMLARGYLLFVEDDGKTRRVSGFDPETDEYIVKLPGRRKGWSEIASKEKGKAKPKLKRLPARKTRATAVAPTAGG